MLCFISYKKSFFCFDSRHIPRDFYVKRTYLCICRNNIFSKIFILNIAQPNDVPTLPNPYQCDCNMMVYTIFAKVEGYSSSLLFCHMLGVILSTSYVHTGTFHNILKVLTAQVIAYTCFLCTCIFRHTIFNSMYF